MAPCIFEDNFDLLVVLNRLGSRTDFLKELAKSKIWFALGRKENFWGPFTCIRVLLHFYICILSFCCTRTNVLGYRTYISKYLLCTYLDRSYLHSQ